MARDDERLGSCCAFTCCRQAPKKYCWQAVGHHDAGSPLHPSFQYQPYPGTTTGNASALQSSPFMIAEQSDAQRTNHYRDWLSEIGRYAST
ncbi:hypothetical protein M404DRAFT_555492 [Pisolithus tinctorius Marx 270]|uniref:Uncharacterized protein n=1 Tax=Pisolithus tinctorius Marx 270 TaxID=870435 RepID=A0A0C3I7E9_PISTI|nr:hypothetical protein M404DRAFT_555492 [Pisolithus tinctorius Marx 270]